MSADQFPADNKVLQSVRADHYKLVGETSEYVFLLNPNNQSVVVLPSANSTDLR